MARQYRQRKRAEARQTTRDRIMQATMELHDEKGVADTTFADIATRSGLGAATVHRHFSSVSDLVQACGMHVWQDMRPPTPETSAAVFEGAATQSDRLRRLVDELDAFYGRGGFRLLRAAQDRDRVPELDGFLHAIEAGLESLIRHALGDQQDIEVLVPVFRAITSVSVWTDLGRSDLSPKALAAVKIRLLECTLKASRPPAR